MGDRLSVQTLLTGGLYIHDCMVDCVYMMRSSHFAAVMFVLCQVSVSSGMDLDRL